MSNIDNELAFGEYVSLPIRTEKTAEETAEEKWIELGKRLNEAALKARHERNLAIATPDSRALEKALYTMSGLQTAIHIMDELDELDT